MKSSPHGAPICTGAGVAAVRKRIEDAFASIHTNIDTNANLPEIESVEGVIPMPTKPLRPLVEKAEPILRSAVIHTRLTAVHRTGVHIIEAPQKTAAQLIAEALKVIGGKR
jgi:hypothetical protein